jgi:hypothetical protein
MRKKVHSWLVLARLQVGKELWRPELVVSQSVVVLLGP